MQRPLVTAAIREALERMEARQEAPMRKEPEAAGGVRVERQPSFSRSLTSSRDHPHCINTNRWVDNLTNRDEGRIDIAS